MEGLVLIALILWVVNSVGKATKKAKPVPPRPPVKPAAPMAAEEKPVVLQTTMLGDPVEPMEPERMIPNPWRFHSRSGPAVCRGRAWKAWTHVIPRRSANLRGAWNIGCVPIPKHGKCIPRRNMRGWFRSLPRKTCARLS